MPHELAETLNVNQHNVLKHDNWKTPKAKALHKTQEVMYYEMSFFDSTGETTTKLFNKIFFKIINISILFRFIKIYCFI